MLPEQTINSIITRFSRNLFIKKIDIIFQINYPTTLSQ